MVKAVLSRESEYAFHFKQNPSLKKTLKTLSAELDGTDDNEDPMHGIGLRVTARW